jgi:hypothetical protein
MGRLAGGVEQAKGRRRRREGAVDEIAGNQGSPVAADPTAVIGEQSDRPAALDPDADLGEHVPRLVDDPIDQPVLEQAHPWLHRASSEPDDNRPSLPTGEAVFLVDGLLRLGIKGRIAAAL